LLKFSYTKVGKNKYFKRNNKF